MNERSQLPENSAQEKIEATRKIFEESIIPYRRQRKIIKVNIAGFVRIVSANANSIAIFETFPPPLGGRINFAVNHCSPGDKIFTEHSLRGEM